MGKYQYITFECRQNKDSTCSEQASSYYNLTLDININGSKLTQVNHAKLLEMEVDDDLSFDYHVDNTSKKISRRIGILKNINSYLPINEWILFYTTP